MLGCGCAAGKASVCTTRLFRALGVVCGVAVCSSPPVFQAGVVQAVRPRRPARPCLGFGLGRSLSLVRSGGEVSSLPRGPTRRSRGRGVALWPVSPEFRPPAPLSSGVRQSICPFFLSFWGLADEAENRGFCNWCGVNRWLR